MRIHFAVEFPTESIQYRKETKLYMVEDSKEIANKADITYPGQAKKLTTGNSSLSLELEGALIATFNRLKTALRGTVLPHRPIEVFWKREAKIADLQRQVRDGFIIIAKQIYE